MTQIPQTKFRIRENLRCSGWIKQDEQPQNAGVKTLGGGTALSGLA